MPKLVTKSDIEKFNNDGAIFLKNKFDVKWIEILKVSNYDRNQMFMKELDYYLDCINHNKEPMNSVIESGQVLKIALGIIESSKTKQVVKI